MNLEQVRYWRVAVEAPLPEALTYASPNELAPQISRGKFVKVPLGKRHVVGLILEEIQSAPSEFKIKPISEVLPDFPTLSEPFLKWLEWLATYYFHPIGMVTSLALPPLETKHSKRTSQRPSVVPEIAFQDPPQLTSEQLEAFKGITSKNEFGTHLLFGVTGSGKTEVYLRILEKTLAANKSGIVLVPEISLTPQLVNRFSQRFGDKVAVIHSQLTDREKTNQWWAAVDKNKRILIGARSALFCPLEDLGVIIVDEEHEPSFKQDEKLKYNGRDAAIVLAKFHNCPIVLGSATPSLETWKNYLEGKYQIHRLKSRVEDRALPQCEIIDLRKTEKNPDLPSWLSDPLYTAIEKTLDRGDQVALFLNRRGVANIVLCPGCGFTYECPNCDISLTLHGKQNLVCHYCDYHERLTLDCPSCKIGETQAVGLGTELVEQDMQRLFPSAKIARADRDEIQNRLDLEDLIQNMETGETQILIGTQMIAKGLDFPKLNLVGLILADIGFNLPDFRSTERSYQLITQVSGRAGRHVKEGESPGLVFIQTYNPEHPSLQFRADDFEKFADFEIEQRAPLGYPPTGKLIAFRLQGTQQNFVSQAARLLADRGRVLKNKSSTYVDVEVLGPAEAPLSKLRGNYRFQLLVKGKDHRKLNAFCHQILGDQSWCPSGVKISVDVDPLNLL